jgi:DNA-binding MarR family transcriptional regulator
MVGRCSLPDSTVPLALLKAPDLVEKACTGQSPTILTRMPAACPPAIAPLSKADYEALADFRYRLRQFLSFSEKAARQAGITPRQHQALLAIKGFPGRDFVSIGELAERLQIAHHSAVELTDRLVTQNLVIRKTGTEDRRAVLLRVTKRGESLLAKLSLTHRAEIHRMRPELQKLLARIDRAPNGSGTRAK